MKIKFNFNFFKKLAKEENKQNVENNNTSDVNKKRRRKNVLESGEVLEPHENKNWKRRGSRLTFPEFLQNIFLNKKRIKYNYYVLLISMLILSVLSVYKTKKVYNENNTESYTTISAFNLQDGNEIDLNKSVSSIFEENFINKEVEKSDSSNVSSNDIKEEIKSAINSLQNTDDKLDFLKPLKEYEIQKIYSTENLIYSKTLDMWKIHNGIDLKAEINSDVYSVENGIVAKIYDDSFLGKTIVIEHNFGYKSAYSNLKDEVNLKVGDKIKKGQKIGKIGNTAIGEFKDDSHLHFSMYKDDELIDPSFIIYE